jgi:RNA polymerase sigma-70 factor (ECF subfamily)
MKERSQNKHGISGKSDAVGMNATSSGLSDISPSVVASIKAGDHEAFKYVYLHFSDNLIRFLTALLRDGDEAREITQNIFITLWEKRDILDPEKGIRRYLYQLAKFHAMDHFDRRKVRDKYEEFCRRGDVYDLAADDIMQSRETGLLIEHVINNMPERRRKVFLMSREHKKSYEEIASELNMNINTVKNDIKISLKELREVLSVFMLFLAG